MNISLNRPHLLCENLEVQLNISVLDWDVVIFWAWENAHRKLKGKNLKI